MVSCNSIKFSYSEKLLPMNAKWECSTLSGHKRASDKMAGIDSTWEIFLRLEKAVQSYKKDQRFEYSDKSKCEEIFMHDNAIVEIQFEGETYMKMKQSLRASTADKLGAIGGTLGLFSGFSLLAIIEALYWMCISAAKVYKNQCLKKRRSLSTMLE